MILVKTPKKGNSTFTCKCVVCKEPILSPYDGNVLFDMEKSLQEESEVYFIHKKCMGQQKTLNGKELFSKDLSEFFEILFPDLRFEKIS